MRLRVGKDAKQCGEALTHIEGTVKRKNILLQEKFFLSPLLQVTTSITNAVFFCFSVSVFAAPITHQD